MKKRITGWIAAILAVVGIGVIVNNSTIISRSEPTYIEVTDLAQITGRDIEVVYFRLMTDLTVTNTISVGANGLEIDLNGHNMTASEGVNMFTLSPAADVTLFNSDASATPVVKSNGGSNYVFYMKVFGDNNEVYGSVTLGQPGGYDFQIIAESTKIVEAEQDIDVTSIGKAHRSFTLTKNAGSPNGNWTLSPKPVRTLTLESYTSILPTSNAGVGATEAITGDWKTDFAVNCSITGGEEPEALPEGTTIRLMDTSSEYGGDEITKSTASTVTPYYLRISLPSGEDMPYYVEDDIMVLPVLFQGLNSNAWFLVGEAGNSQHYFKSASDVYIKSANFSTWKLAIGPQDEPQTGPVALDPAATTFRLVYAGALPEGMSAPERIVPVSELGYEIDTVAPTMTLKDSTYTKVGGNGLVLPAASETLSMTISDDKRIQAVQFNYGVSNGTKGYTSPVTASSTYDIHPGVYTQLELQDNALNTTKQIKNEAGDVIFDWEDNTKLYVYRQADAATFELHSDAKDITSLIYYYGDKWKITDDVAEYLNGLYNASFLIQFGDQSGIIQSGLQNSIQTQIENIFSIYYSHESLAGQTISMYQLNGYQDDSHAVSNYNQYGAIIEHGKLSTSLFGSGAVFGSDFSFSTCSYYNIKTPTFADIEFAKVSDDTVIPTIGPDATELKTFFEGLTWSHECDEAVSVSNYSSRGFTYIARAPQVIVNQSGTTVGNMGYIYRQFHIEPVYVEEIKLKNRAFGWQSGETPELVFYDGNGQTIDGPSEYAFGILPLTEYEYNGETRYMMPEVVPDPSEWQTVASLSSLAAGGYWITFTSLDDTYDLTNVMMVHGDGVHRCDNGGDDYDDYFVVTPSPVLEWKSQVAAIDGADWIYGNGYYDAVVWPEIPSGYTGAYYVASTKGTTTASQVAAASWEKITGDKLQTLLPDTYYIKGVLDASGSFLGAEEFAAGTIIVEKIVPDGISVSIPFKAVFEGKTWLPEGFAPSLVIGEETVEVPLEDFEIAGESIEGRFPVTTATVATAHKIILYVSYKGNEIYEAAGPETIVLLGLPKDVITVTDANGQEADFWFDGEIVVAAHDVTIDARDYTVTLTDVVAQMQGTSFTYTEDMNGAMSNITVGISDGQNIYSVAYERRCFADAEAPMIAGIEDGAVLYGEGYLTSIHDRYLSSVTINGVAQTIDYRSFESVPGGERFGTRGQVVYTFEKVNMQYVIEAIDYLGHVSKKTIWIMSNEAGKPIVTGVKLGLVRGFKYTFSGETESFKIAGDNTTYFMKTFYAGDDGDYEFE